MSRNSTDDSVAILLVEDDQEDARRIREAFAGVDAEVAFHVVGDGTEALAFLRDRGGGRERPDLVFLDLTGTDGFEVLEAIRDDPETASLPVLVLTRSEDRDDVAESYRLSANAYLVKPDDPAGFESLARAVERFWFERVRLPSDGS